MSLLALPFEVRQEIYSYLLTSQEPLYPWLSVRGKTWVTFHSNQD